MKFISSLTLLVTLLILGACSATQPVQKSTSKHKMMRHMFQSVPVQKAQILQQGQNKTSCAICGMNLPMFYKTNHVAEVDGKVKQYCSIHCLAEDKVLNHKKVQNIKVVDVKSLRFIPVEKATYVVGSDVRGTMSRVSKYAFANRADAEAFAKKHGGKITDFQGAFAEAAKELTHKKRN